MRSGASGRYRQDRTAARIRVAANQLHLAAAIDRRDRQTDGRTDGHRTVTQTLEAGSVKKTESVQSRRLENRKRCMSRFSKIKRFERLERLLPQSVLTPRTPCRQLPFLLSNIR